MTFSNGLPVQFWLTDCETFNEEEVDGINHVCWCQPWNCSDEIFVQFKDTSGQTLFLQAIDADEESLFEEEIPEVSTGVYQLSIVPEDMSPEICNTNIQLRIGTNTGSFSELAKSDCLHIKTSHPGTKLIEYWQSRNYDGLVYEGDVSPELHFFLRVPCVFFHKRFNQEDNAIERTNSTVVTSSKFEKQKLMQVKHAPDYFHEKLLIALSHHNVLIDDKYWRKKEAYEKEEGDIHYPLKKATVYLTEKNSPRRNVL